MKRPDRSLTGAHNAMRDTLIARGAAPKPERSIPLRTVLRWMLATALVTAAASMAGGAIFDMIRGALS